VDRARVHLERERDNISHNMTIMLQGSWWGVWYRYSTITPQNRTELENKDRCCGSETIFFGSGFGSHVRPSLRSGSRFGSGSSLD
jgi:hypothetical protein